MIFRNDDVSANTNLMYLKDYYEVIRDVFPESRIISGITVFSSGGVKGSVYDDVPFKDKPLNWFYNVNSVLSSIDRVSGERASHGLVHVDHSNLSRDAQEMSILTSCHYLKARGFIPPFNRWNEDTIKICLENHIQFLAGPEWKSFEFEPFNPDHKYWYFHSWRFTPEKLREVISGNAISIR